MGQKKFEGPEKRLDLYFSSSGKNPFNLNLKDWTPFLRAAECQIISSLLSPSCHMYLLSESSLIVKPHHVILKTCGTTQPLKFLQELYKENFILSSLLYSHRNFIFPQDQPFPYSSRDEEIKSLIDLLPREGSHKTMTTPDWIGIFWIKDPTTSQAPSFCEISMTGLSRDITSKFYSVSKENGHKVITRLLGTEDIDYYQFEPLGVSVNGLSKETTIHITPEDDFSYLSVEKNEPFDSNEWINFFRPRDMIEVSCLKTPPLDNNMSDGFYFYLCQDLFLFVKKTSFHSLLKERF